MMLDDDTPPPPPPFASGDPCRRVPRRDRGIPAELLGSSGSSTPSPVGSPPGLSPGAGSSAGSGQVAWRDRVMGSTIPQLRRWLAHRGLPTDGAKLQLVQAVLRSTDDSPQTERDFQLIPWHEQRAQYLREQRQAQIAAARTVASAGVVPVRDYETLRQEKFNWMTPAQLEASKQAG